MPIIAESNPYEHTSDDESPCEACAYEAGVNAQFNAFFQPKVDEAKAQGFNAGIAMERQRCLDIITAGYNPETDGESDSIMRRYFYQKINIK